MLKFEYLHKVHKETDRLIKDYFARTNAQKGQPPFDMDWMHYITLEQRGNLMLFTARERGELIGMAMYMLSPHPHHAGYAFAICDTLGVNPDYRGRGVGRALVEFAEKHLRAHGMDYMLHGYRSVYGVTPLFEKIGFD